MKVLFVDKIQLISRFYATTSDDAKSWISNDVMEERGHELGPHELDSHDDKSAYIEHRHSHGSFNANRPIFEMVPDRESTTIALAQLLSPASVHEHSAAVIDLGQLVVDDDVGTDISIFRASTTSPSMISGERSCSSPQPLGHRVSSRHKRRSCFSSTGTIWERRTIPGSCLEPSGQALLRGWMDSTDTERHFSVDPGERARGDPVLYAILAYAARHLARVAGLGSTVSDDRHVKGLDCSYLLLVPRSTSTLENKIAAIGRIDWSGLSCRISHVWSWKGRSRSIYGFREMDLL